MIGTIRRCNISTRSGILAAILVASSFALVQVTCLTHTHCDGAACFEHSEESFSQDSHLHAGWLADHQCGHQPGPECGDEHQDHDIHHTSRDAKTHPKQRFTSPDIAAVSADETSEYIPVFGPAESPPETGNASTLERYGPALAERAPPLC